MQNVFKDPETLLKALADFIVAKAHESIARSGAFNFALSGGSSPKKLYALLVTEFYRHKIEWQNVFFFFGDERNVPADHPESNYLMAKNAMFSALSIPEDHIFAVNTMLPPSESAKAYERTIRDHFKSKCSFDLILLGLGDDAHTASLFPHTAVLHETKALVKDIFVEKVQMHRITFTAPLINLARAVAFLVYGESKANAVHQVLEGPSNLDEYPAQLIHPDKGELHWFLDEAAATKINRN